MSYQKEAQGQTQDLLERLHLSAAFGGGGERRVWASLLRLVPPRPEPRKLAGNGGMVSDVKI